MYLFLKSPRRIMALIMFEGIDLLIVRQHGQIVSRQVLNPLCAG